MATPLDSPSSPGNYPVTPPRTKAQARTHTQQAQASGPLAHRKIAVLTAMGGAPSSFRPLLQPILSPAAAGSSSPSLEGRAAQAGKGTDTPPTTPLKSPGRDDSDEAAASPPPAKASKKPPKAPAHLSYNRREWDQCPFVQHVLKTHDQIGAAIQSGGSIELCVHPQKTVVISNLREIGRGDNSIAYECMLEGKKCVVKILKPTDAVRDPREFVRKFGNQLKHYAAYMAIEELKPFVATHENLDYYLEKATEMLGEYSDPEDLETLFGNFVKDNVFQSVHLLPFIPNEFPLNLDRSEDPHNPWVQLREIIRLSRKHNTPIDLFRANVRVREDGQVQIIDLFEMNEVKASDLLPERFRSFTKNHKDWPFFDPEIVNDPIWEVLKQAEKEKK